jgi:hypothetical protein
MAIDRLCFGTRFVTVRLNGVGVYRKTCDEPQAIISRRLEG